MIVVAVVVVVVVLVLMVVVMVTKWRCRDSFRKGGSCNSCRRTIVKSVLGVVLVWWWHLWWWVLWWWVLWWW